MNYEDTILQLCEVIKESEHNAEEIFNNIESIDGFLQDLSLPLHQKNKLSNFISNIYGLLQNQDLHRQKIERVVNFVCDNNGIDKAQYNLAPSAKNIDASEDTLDADELEALIKSMQS
jgi:histidyl-tRNA synthetase